MIRICPSCRTANRVAPQNLAMRGRCGSCKEPLSPLAEPVDVGQAEFDAIITGARVPVLVDFWAPWCGPCKMAAPEVAKAAANLAGRAIVLKVNTEVEQQLAARYAIRSIPNFAVFREGSLQGQQAGLMGHTQLEQLI